MNHRVFECKMCGNCCSGEGGIIITFKEIDRISNYLNISREKFIERYTEQTSDGKYSIKSINGYCVFFVHKKGCTIHKVKPDICKAWPFFKGNLEDIHSFFMAKDYCPGILEDISFDEFREFGYRFLAKNKIIKDENIAPNALKVLNINKDG